MLTVQELADAARATSDNEMKRRIDVVRMLVAGFTHAEIEWTMCVAVSTIRDIEKRYAATGLDGLRDRRRRGFRLSEDQNAALKRALAGPPPQGEMAWTGASVRRWLQRTYDRRVSDRRARELLAAAA